MPSDDKGGGDMSINIIGITGPSGSGKSVLCTYLAKRNVPMIDADAVYHSLLVAGSDCTNALSTEFGAQILDENGVPDRKKLGAIVFSSAEKLEKLNKIVLDFVLVEIRKIIAAFEKDGHKNVLVDAPTLIESGFAKECNAVVSVLAPKDVRLGRICKRDGISAERAKQRIDAQPSDDFYKNNSNHLLTNDNQNEEFYLRADELFNTLLK